MRDHPLPAEHRRALLVLPGAPEALQALEHQGFDVATWVAPRPDPGYGEALVQGVTAALAADGATLLVVPDPEDGDRHRRALALAGIEAARRIGDVTPAWLPAGVLPESPAWTVLAADSLADELPALVRGIHDDRVRMPAFEVPDAGAVRVSVIVRSMDRPSLAAALDSIALQTYRATEVVIVNARGPEHRLLPAHCGGLPVVGAAPAPARPLPRARAANLGVDAASGPLLLFLDDDDLLLPDHLIRLVGALIAHPEAPAAYTDVAFGRFDGGRWQQKHCFDAEFDPTRLLFENYLPIHGVMFRKAHFGAGARFDERFDLFEDWDFWLQLAQQGDFVHVPGVSARYLVSETGQSEVFSETPAAQTARARLFEKWRHRIHPEQYAAALRRMQALYREAAQSRAELRLLRTGQARMRGVIAAREAEIASAARHAANLGGIVAEREREITAAAEHAAGLEYILAQRQREVDDALVEIGALRSIVDAREREIAGQAEGLVDLARKLADQDRSLADLAAAALQKEATIASMQAELSRLRAEGPLQALRRALRR